jgi:uncharacterized surface protein with fasciclin (FAS1) repeats
MLLIKKNMNFSSTLRNLILTAGAASVGLMISAPAQANTSAEALLADNHTTDAMMDSSEQEGMMSEGMTIVDVAQQSESFNTLVQAVQAADLANTLSGEGPYTVFAPTDSAFEQLPDGALEFLLQPENQDLLAEVLSYHVVPGEITASEITPGGISTLNGGVAVAVQDSRVIVNNASVVNANIEASNGVVHAINRVLIPEALQQELAAQLNVAEIY